MPDLKKILFINFGGIGDEILFLPTIAAVKEKFPDARITLCCEPRSSGIKDLTDNIDEIITANLKKSGYRKYVEAFKLLLKMREGRYDAVISSGSNRAIALLEYLSQIPVRIGFLTGSRTDKYFTSGILLNKDQYAAKMYFDLVKDLTGIKYSRPVITAGKIEGFEDFVLIHPGVSKMSVKKHIYKSLPVNVLQDLIKMLLYSGTGVMLSGGPDDEEIIGEILSDDEIKSNENFVNYYGKTKNLKELAALFNSVKHIFCCDSAPLHIAVGLNVPATVFFGPTDEKKLLPISDRIFPISAICSCRPCLWDKRNKNCEQNYCLAISAEDIFKEIQKRFQT